MFKRSGIPSRFLFEMAGMGRMAGMGMGMGMTFLGIIVHLFSSAITTYLLAHTLKHLNQIRVLSLPKQCDDDVASIIGINCPRSLLSIRIV